MTLQSFDWALIDRMQRVADVIHEWTGLDCIQQARVMHASVGAFWLWLIVDGAMTHHQVDWLGALAFLGRLKRAFWETPDDRLARSTSACAHNPRRISPFDSWFRYIATGVCLPLAVMDAIRMARAFWIGLWMCWWAACYLEACDVRRPRAGRIRESLRGVERQLAPAGGRA